MKIPTLFDRCPVCKKRSFLNIVGGLICKLKLLGPFDYNFNCGHVETFDSPYIHSYILIKTENYTLYHYYKEEFLRIEDKEGNFLLLYYLKDENELNYNNLNKFIKRMEIELFYS